MNKDDVLRLLKQNKTELDKFGVKQLGIFGSFVRNQQTNHSDIDVLVTFNRNQKNYQNLIKLNDYLEGILGRKVDVVTTESLSPYIGPYITKEVIYV